MIIIVHLQSQRHQFKLAMQSPLTKSLRPPSSATALSSSYSPTRSPPLPHSPPHHPPSTHSHRHHYLKFKRKLLLALTHTDPLGLLQEGIFQEYEQAIINAEQHRSTSAFTPNKRTHFQQHFQGFQHKMNSYDVGGGLTVTQLERRSRSCEPLSLENNALRRLEEQRNVEFVIFANALRHISGIQHGIYSQTNGKPIEESGNILQQNYDNIEEEKQESLKENTVHAVSKQLEKVQEEKQQLYMRLCECQAKLQQQKSLNAFVHNERTDRELEFLLKEKQLNKKIQQYREQNEHLRGLLQANASTSNETTINSQPPSQNQPSRLLNLKERVAAEGRFRWALSRAWGAQLQTNCH